MRSLEDIIKEALALAADEAKETDARGRKERGDVMLREEWLSEARGMRLAIASVRKHLFDAGVRLE